MSALRNHRRNVLRETIQQVADRSGISIGTISTVERGAEPSPYHIKKIAKAYRLSLAKLQKLLGGDSNYENQSGVHNAGGVPNDGTGSAAGGSGASRQMPAGVDHSG